MYLLSMPAKKIASLLIISIFSIFYGMSSIASTRQSVATFAGGCFWCMEEVMVKTPGVIKVTSGYTGGQLIKPSYSQVSSGRTKHVEAVQVIFNPQQISYQQLLNIFWKNIDPTDQTGQFCDKGQQYRAVIFYHNTQQEQLAKDSKKRLEQSKKFPKIVVPILPAKQFYPAENYHQQYYLKNPYHYKYYKYRCGRKATLKKLWDH